MEAAKYLFIPDIPKILIWVLHSVSCFPDELSSLDPHTI